MAERPILFSAPMVRAILAGTKTQTRRVVKLNDAGRVARGGRQWHIDDDHAALACPYGQPGDWLWVKETWRPAVAHSCAMDACDCGDVTVTYRADGDAVYHRDRDIDPDWTLPKAADRGNVSPLFMPRWASRITLEVTDVHVERLQNISEADVWAEGIDRSTESPTQASTNFSAYASPRLAFMHLWASINGADSWDANPWVWVVSFRRLEA